MFLPTATTSLLLLPATADAGAEFRRRDARTGRCDRTHAAHDVRPVPVPDAETSRRQEVFTTTAKTGPVQEREEM